MKLKRGSQIKLNTEMLKYKGEIASELYTQLNILHSRKVENDKEIDLYFYSNIVQNLQLNFKSNVRDGVFKFSPSSAYKCSRELYYDLLYKDNEPVTLLNAYQTRWIRNSSFIHMAIQRDLLYLEKYCTGFNVLRLNGNPAWEENVKTVKYVEHKGETFAISGMMDGILQYTPTDLTFGLEIKTKSNSVAQVGTYLMKSPLDAHIMQCVAYSLMFDITDFVILYESLAKDTWNKGSNARNDIRAFQFKIEHNQQLKLKEKFIDVIKAVKSRTVPVKETDKCMFCQHFQECNKT